MELVNVALGFAIVIVLIILWKCRKGKNSKKPRRGNYAQAFSGGKVNVNNDYANTLDSRDNLPLIAQDPVGSGALNVTLDDQNKKLKQMPNFGDYPAMMQMMSLEPEVFASQNAYTKEMTNSTSGASTQSVRDDPNDINPWSGLRASFRNYSAVYSDNTARVVSTETPDQLIQPKKYTFI